MIISNYHSGHHKPYKTYILVTKDLKEVSDELQEIPEGLHGLKTCNRLLKAVKDHLVKILDIQPDEEVSTLREFLGFTYDPVLVLGLDGRWFLHAEVIIPTTTQSTEFELIDPYSAFLNKQKELGL